MSRNGKADGGVGAVRRVASDSEKKFVKSFVKSEIASSAVGIGSVERIGREQQRRAVAYGRSRGQL